MHKNEYLGEQKSLESLSYGNAVPISISLSNRPGRLRAGSILSGLFVAAITRSPSVLLIPSIKLNNVPTIL